MLTYLGITKYTIIYVGVYMVYVQIFILGHGNKIELFRFEPHTKLQRDIQASYA